MVRKLAQKVLKGYGYTVLTAKNGKEAIRISEAHEAAIHLMLTDVVMPGMSGRVLAQHFESIGSKIKVLYISGYTDHTIVKHGILNSEMNFIQKPFTSEILANKIRETLDQSYTKDVKQIL